MNEMKQEYKQIVLRAARIAVKGGGISPAYEEYLIDNIDQVLDGMPEGDFDHLMMNKTIPVREIESDEQYKRLFEQREAIYHALSNGSMNTVERDRMEESCRLLDEVLDGYSGGVSELADRIRKGAEFIESLAPDDPRLPAAHSKYNKLVEEYQREVLG